MRNNFFKSMRGVSVLFIQFANLILVEYKNIQLHKVIIKPRLSKRIH